MKALQELLTELAASLEARLQILESFGRLLAVNLESQQLMPQEPQPE